MAFKVGLVPMGDDTGLIVPANALAQMKVKAGDTVHLIEMLGGYLLTPRDPDFVRMMEATREFMDKYSDVLSKLARS